MNPTPLEPVSFFRRLGAMFYDALLIGITALLLGGILGTILSNLWGWHEIPANSLASKLLFVFELMVAFLLFAWFWTHGGQTLGMRAWKIRVVTETGGSINWQQAAMRFFWSLFSWLALGVGFWVALIDPERRTWHDRLSHSRIVRA